MERFIQYLPSKVNSQFGKFPRHLYLKKDIARREAVSKFGKRSLDLLTERIFGQLVQSCLPQVLKNYHSNSAS